MSALISVVGAAIVLATLRDEVGVLAMEQTQQGADYFGWHIREQLERGFQDKALVQRELDRFASARKKRLIGTIVSANIIDLGNNSIANFTDEMYLHQRQIQSWLLSEPHVIPKDRSGVYEIKDVNGHPHIRITVPIEGESDIPLAWVQTVVAVSDVAYSEVVSRIVRAVAIIIFVIVATTILLYPVIINLLNKLSNLSINLLDANLEIIKVLGSAIANKDSDTDAHNYRVTLMAVRMAEAVGLNDDEIRSLIKGAFLHDVGKIGTPDNVLLKPGKLDENEFGIMQQHVIHGLDIIKQSGWLQDAAAVVGGHHEKYDGKGYPLGLSKEQVPILARIFSLVDVFDALTCKRPYKEPFSFETTMEILEEGRGNHFDPKLLDVFTELSTTFFKTIAGREDDGIRTELHMVVEKYFSKNIIEYL